MFRKSYLSSEIARPSRVLQLKNDLVIPCCHRPFFLRDIINMTLAIFLYVCSQKLVRPKGHP